jgi:hypothetical protein
MILNLTPIQVNAIFVALQRNQEILAETLQEVQKQATEQSLPKEPDITVAP